jgi:hypothetical protein
MQIQNMKTSCSVQKKMIVDALLVGVGGGLLALDSLTQIPSAAHEVPSMYVGFYLIYLGFLFLLSYFCSDKSYILTGLIWLCEHFSHPRGRFMAFIYFGLSLLLGSCALLQALGILRWGSASGG